MSMTRLSRDETMSIVLIGITVAVLAWYRSDLTGIHRWTNTTLVWLVSTAVATATFYMLKKWNPFWYQS